MFPALISIAVGLLTGNLVHHWVFNWSYGFDTWILLSITSVLLGCAWWCADEDSLVESTNSTHNRSKYRNTF